MTADDERRRSAKARNRRSHSHPRRSRAVIFSLTDEEFQIVSAAAEREHLADGAYAALATLAAARGTAHPEYVLLRELLMEIMHATGQVRRVGVNLNQSVAALNSGELLDQLQWYAQAAARTVAKLDDLADQISSRLP